MSEPEAYDALILGSGQAGTPLAGALGRAGWRVAIAERTHWGGTCVNEGCSPTKLMIACAESAHRARRAAEFGVSTGPVTVNLTEVRRLKRELVASFAGGSERGLRAAPNVTPLLGHAHFTAPHQVRVATAQGDRDLTAPHIFINVGARPSVPEVPGLGAVPYLLDSTSIMELAEVPPQLVVLGGGYVGLEFAQMFARFGSQVTVLHRGAQLIDREDMDIADALLWALRDEGLSVHLMMSELRVEPLGTGAARLHFETPDGSQTVETAHLLVAAGRAPNTDTLGTLAAGLKLDARGFIPVNARLETNVPGVYALGDVNGGPAFTHVAYDDFRTVRDALLGGGRRPERLSTYTLFTDPQLGRVGLSERDARERGLDVLVATLPMAHVARAIETRRTAGLMKAVVDRATHRILGAAVLGPEGGEVTAALQLAMLGNLPFTDIRDAVISHPTLAESLNNLFMTLGDVPPLGDSTPLTDASEVSHDA